MDGGPGYGPGRGHRDQHLALRGLYHGPVLRGHARHPQGRPGVRADRRREPLAPDPLLLPAADPRHEEINLILTITGCLRAFDIFYLLTSGGPGTSTKVVSMRIMETAFQSYKYGRALAMSIVLFVIVVFTMVIFRLILTPREKE